MGAILVSSSVTGTRKSDRCAAGSRWRLAFTVVGKCPVSFKYYIFGVI